MEYIVISDHSLARFNERLNETVGEGWVLVGNLSVCAFGTSGREVLYSQMFSRLLPGSVMIGNHVVMVSSEVGSNGS